MKKVMAFLLVAIMLSGVLLVGVFAAETPELGDGNTDCTCGGSYGGWVYPDGGECAGGRYERVCNDCGNKQTAKDIMPTTISYMTPAIGANKGDLVMLSMYDVYFTSSTVKSAKDIVWSSEDIEIVNNRIYTDTVGTYKLTATAGSSTKSVYLIVKEPTDTEYVLFFDNFERDTNGDGKFDANDKDAISIPTKGNASANDYEIIQQPSGTSAYIQGGKLALNTLGNAGNQMRVILPKWIGDFGDYKIDTSFTIDSTVDNDISRWFATMARVKNDSDYFPIWQAAVRQGARDYYNKGDKGVEISYTGNGVNWDVKYFTKYTENIASGTYYTQTFEIAGTEATHSINGTKLLDTRTGSTKPAATVGLVGFHLRAALVYVESIKIVVPIDDTIHNFSDWTTVNKETCTTDGLEKKTCTNCGAVEERVIAGGHKIVSHAMKVPTCTESGWSAYETCSVCDHSTFKGEVAALGHYFDREFHSVAHRGYSDGAPENTLRAYRLAKELGYVYVECDIMLTKDGVAVLFHDDSLADKKIATGKISDYTLDELRAFDFGSWKGAEFAGTKIPTFEEFIALCKELGLHPYLELKKGIGLTQDKTNELVAIVENYGMEDNCSWISFDSNYLKYVKNADATARLGYVSSSLNDTAVTTAMGLRNGSNEVFLNVSYTVINDTTALLAASNGIALEAWTIDTAANIKNLPKYVSGVSSNKLFAEDYVLTTKETAPTCIEQGYTTHTCICGVTKTDDYVSAKGHAYEDGVCADCGDVLYCADSTHNLEIISISYENGYDMPGVKIVKCLDCDGAETETVAPALLTCVGYSAPEDGSNGLVLGFEIDNGAIDEYGVALGNALEIGVVFAGYDNLAGQQPLDENGNAISLEVGKVIKADLSGFDYRTYDFVLNGINDSIKDVKLVIAAYIYDGESVKYVQENGAGDKVIGVSYNEVKEMVKE